MPKSKGKILKWVLFGYLIINISGCATSKFPPTDPQDPYEHFNRKVFAFNMAIDRTFYRPVAKVYDAVLPWPVKTGVRNFFVCCFTNIGGHSTYNLFFLHHLCFYGILVTVLIVNKKH